MKQTLFLVAMMMYFTFRSFSEPFWAILMYYGLAVLRPQGIWDWALPKGIRWSFYAAMVAIVVTAVRMKPLKKRAVQSAFIPLVLLFAVCLFCSYVGAIDRNVAGRYGWEYAKVLLMLVVASFAVTERRHMKYLAWMIFLCLTYIVYEMNALYVFSKRLYIYHQGFGGYDNNGAALALAMVIPFCYFFFLAEQRWRRWLYLACAVPAAHAVMLSYSRGAMISCFVMGTGMLLTTARRRFLHTVCAAVLFVAAVVTLAGPSVRSRFTSMADKLRDPSAQSRYTSWRAGWRIARDYPIFGVGLRNSNALTKDYGADKEGRTIHNVYLQIAADAGVPAASLFAALTFGALFWLARGAHLTRDKLDQLECRWHYHICLGSFWSLAAFAVGGLFLSFEVFELCYLLMFMGAVAPALAIQGVEEHEQPSPNAHKTMPPVAVLTTGDASS